MARVRIEIDNGCDGCWQKDKTATEGVTLISLAGKTWYLCEEHEAKLAGQLKQALGEGEESK